MTSGRKGPKFSIDAESVAAARAELHDIVQGNPIAEAAVEGFNDWQVIESMERLWAAAEPETPSPSSSPRSPGFESR